MRGEPVRRTTSGIGALTRRDRAREAAIAFKIRDSYRSLATTTSSRGRRRHIRDARRHERTLLAHRRRPQSLLVGLVPALGVLLVILVLVHAPMSVPAIVAAVLALDVLALRRRRRMFRRA
jgi:VIT1/CCC1 family predicted Fe2+/Mn2+ transporter